MNLVFFNVSPGMKTVQSVRILTLAVLFCSAETDA
jgi:hypothetical protein